MLDPLKPDATYLLKKFSSNYWQVFYNKSLKDLLNVHDITKAKRFGLIKRALLFEQDLASPSVLQYLGLTRVDIQDLVSLCPPIRIHLIPPLRSCKSAQIYKILLLRPE